ncbi:MAG TPA: hypothetical protein PLS84_03310 [Salinivirgaceae bacterium]|nr:hypothetical protein [Salinivirgaceae bacterium]
MSKSKGIGNPALVASAVASGIDPTTKKIILLGALALVGLVGYKVYKKIFVPKVDRDVQDMNERIMRMSQEINRNNRSITDNEAHTIALSLYDAMKRGINQNKTVLSILNKLKTRDDYLTVYTIFGAKPYGFRGSADSLFAKHLYADGKDLHGWFISEFSTKEKERDLNPILAKFGVQL